MLTSLAPIPYSPLPYLLNASTGSTNALLSDGINVKIDATTTPNSHAKKKKNGLN
jgi:hypothetical protein